MNKQQIIRQNRIAHAAFWIHKGLRWSQDPASAKAWQAIHDLDDEEWFRIVEYAIKEAGIVIKR